MERSNARAVGLLAMVLALPVFVIASSLLNYIFVVCNYSVLVTVATVMFSGLCVLFLREKEQECSRLVRIIVVLLMPLSVLNLLFYMWESASGYVTLMASAWIVFSVILACTVLKSVVLKVIYVILALFLFLPICFMALFIGIGKNTVVNTLASPEGTYCGEVIDSDQGALGGDTTVLVYNKKHHVDFCFFEFRKKPQCVYVGEWGEFKNMDIYWTSDEELMINGNSYMVE